MRRFTSQMWFVGSHFYGGQLLVFIANFAYLSQILQLGKKFAYVAVKRVGDPNQIERR